MSVDIKQPTYFVTVATQHGFENSPSKISKTRKIHTWRILMIKVSFPYSCLGVTTISYEIYLSYRCLQSPLSTVNEINRQRKVLLTSKLSLRANLVKVYFILSIFFCLFIYLCFFCRSLSIRH